MFYYAGIGSRETPKEFLDLFTKIASWLSKNGYVLRSGGADGADLAFEKGVTNNLKEIYLPWKYFNNSNSDLVVHDEEAFQLAEKFHPYWQILKQGAKKLHARNTHQVLGRDLLTPSDFIICWTKNGKELGGTAEAIRIAKAYNIPIFNCGKYTDINKCRQDLWDFLKKNIKQRGQRNKIKCLDDSANLSNKDDILKEF